jgi:hypothetical protein
MPDPSKDLKERGGLDLCEPAQLHLRHGELQLDTHLVEDLGSLRDVGHLLGTPVQIEDESGIYTAHALGSRILPLSGITLPRRYTRRWGDPDPAAAPACGCA